MTVLLAVAVGVAIMRPGGDPSRSWQRTWLLVSAALIAIYTGQELAEGWLAASHPDGLAGVFGSGGWIAIPAALAFGAVGTAAMHGRATARRLTAAVRLLRPRFSDAVAVEWASPPVARLRVMAAAGPSRAPPLAR